MYGFTGEERYQRMKSLIKKVLKSNKEIVSSLLLVFVTCVVLILALFCVNRTTAWFANNRTVDGTAMQVVMRGERFDILVSRDSVEFDRRLYSSPIYPGIAELKNTLNAEGYSTTAGDVSANTSGPLAFEMINEYMFDNEYYLMPDSYGTITFYIKPTTPVVDPEDNFVVDFTVNLAGYVETNTDPVRVTNERVHNLLNGHILLFEEREGTTRSTFKYRDLILGSFSYDTSEHSPITSEDYLNGCYEVTIYWDWPLSYYEILEFMSTSSTESRYPLELETYINDHRDYFFATNTDSTEVELLTDGYDDGDQTIGSYCDFLTVFIDASEHN